LDRPQVYPGSHETGSEGVPEGVPGHSVEAGSLVLPVRGSERSLRGLHDPHELAADGAVGAPANQFVRISRATTLRHEVQKAATTVLIIVDAPEGRVREVGRAGV